MSHSRKPFVAVVSDTMPPEALLPLRRLAANVVILPPDPHLAAPVSSHPDMLLFSLGNTLVTYSSYYATAKDPIDRLLSYTGQTLCLTAYPHTDRYPHDIGLNALVCGRFLFGKLDALAPEVIELAKAHDLTPVSVAQGYAACSGLALDDTTLWTADPSLTDAATAHGLTVLSAPYSEITLPGYDHGFIGGCGGVWRNILYLCGTPTPAQLQRYCTHPVFRDRAIQFLYDGPLFDCGGIRIFPI